MTLLGVLFIIAAGLVLAFGRFARYVTFGLVLLALGAALVIAGAIDLSALEDTD